MQQLLYLQKLENKYEQLLLYLQKLENIVVALSGGLDSRFLVFMAIKANIGVQVIHARGIHFQETESLWAEKWARGLGLNPHTIDFNPLIINEVRLNDIRRCYYCKKALMRQMLSHIGKNKICGVLCDGTNADDLKKYRPGLQALREENIYSPLAECNIGKEKIRELAKKYGMEKSDQFARPCLLTRFVYNYPIDLSMLKHIATVELELEKIGLQDFRLRFTPQLILYSQPLPSLLKEEALKILYCYFQQYIKIIEEEKISGMFDRV